MVSQAELTKQAAEIENKNLEQIFDHLAVAGGGLLTRDNAITHIPGTQIGLPKSPTPMTVTNAIQTLVDKQEADSKTIQYTHTFTDFKPKPYDGAYVTQLTIKEVFGLAANGKPIQTMFGEIKPQMVSVRTGPKPEDTVQAPWGHLSLRAPDGQMLTVQLGAGRDSKLGYVFQISIEGPKGLEATMIGLCRLIEQNCKSHSIYKGKAIEYSPDEFEPKFLTPYNVKKEAVAYAKPVFEQLKQGIWGRIQNAEILRKRGKKLNTKTLVHGTFGTGKSLSLALTAQVAIESGWTYIQTAAGESSIAEVMFLAQQYAPAVVAIEDIDVLIPKAGPDREKKLSKILDQFDGVSSKGKEVMVHMTTNYPQDLPKALMRAGRIDNPIEIGLPDSDALERLVTHTFNQDDLADDIDFDKILGEMAGMTPAFIMSIFDDVETAAVIRTGSDDNIVLTTEDFESATYLRRAHFAQHEASQDRPEEEAFGVAFKTIVQEAALLAVSDELNNRQVDMNDGELMSTRSSTEA